MEGAQRSILHTCHPMHYTGLDMFFIREDFVADHLQDGEFRITTNTGMAGRVRPI